MTYRLTFLCFLVSLFLCRILPAQQTMTLTGRVLNAETGAGIDGVVINVKGTRQVTQSGYGGHYFLTLGGEGGGAIEFRLLGFETVEMRPSTAKATTSKDTLLMDVMLKPKPITTPTAVIYAQKVDTVFGNMAYFVEDFQFCGDRFILLTFENSLKKAQVKLVTQDQHVISSADIPDEAVELFKDFQGYINVIGKEKIFRILIRQDHLVLASLPVKQFQSEIMPCADTIPGNILFSNYYKDYPAFSWFKYHVSDTSVQKLKYIKDKDLLEMYEEEFDFLKPADRLAARKMEISSGIDKRIIAAHMTGFAKGIHYTPLYAPLFVARDTAYVFDHYTDRLFRFEKTGTLIDSIPITYHHPKDWREWKHKLIQDQTTRKVYALLQKNGYYLIKHINLQTGKTDAGYRLKYPYVSRIKAENGFVYYVYRPFESGQTKFLYREKLSE